MTRAVAHTMSEDEDWRTWTVIGAIAAISALSIWIPFLIR
jgi:hypothetical protein